MHCQRAQQTNYESSARRALMRRFDSRSFVLLLVVLAAVGGCGPKRQSGDYRRLVAARETLQSELDGLRQNDDNSAVIRVLMESLENAIGGLREGTSLDVPLPVLALIGSESPDGRGQWRVSVQWLEDSFDVDGFYVEDADGNITDYPGTFVWEAAEIEFLANTAWRDIWVLAIPAGSDKSPRNPGSGDASADASCATLPNLDYEGGKIRLGLRTKAGRLPSTVPIVVRHFSGS
jgi:hypothetical protein